MTAIVLHLASLSAKVILLGAIAWVQLSLLRRAPASSRRRLCSAALVAILLLTAGEMLVPQGVVNAPVYSFTVAAPTDTSLIMATPSVAGTVSSWIAFAWMAGATFMLARAVAGRIALWRRRRFNLKKQAEGIDVVIADVQTPMLVGLLRPAILLPETAPAWTDEQRSMVLTHELTHYRQGDCWTNLLAQIVRAVFWFHPVAWLLVARLSKEQELACDDAVVASGHSRHDYAAFLLDAVRSLKSREMFSCAMAGSSERVFKQRFANLLDISPRLASTRWIALSLASLAFLATVLIVVRPVWSQSEPHRVQRDAREVYKVGGDVTPPTVLTKIEPKYTEPARREKISGPVHVSLIVTEDGTPDEIEVTEGIGYGLDESAIEAISQWTFQPGTKQGKAVAVRANVVVNYRLM